MIIFTKFHEDRTKIVDFSLMANFWPVSFFLPRSLLAEIDNNKIWIFQKMSLKWKVHLVLWWKIPSSILSNPNNILSIKHWTFWLLRLSIKCWLKILNKTENAIFTPTLPAWHIRLNCWKKLLIEMPRHAKTNA